MPFEFVKFPGVGRGFSARASLRKSGQLGFNNGARLHYKLQDYSGALLHYDPIGQVIGIELTNDGEDAAVCKLVHRPGNSYIAAKSFCDYFQIQLPQETTRYDLRKDDDSGFLVVELSKRLERGEQRKNLDE